MSGHGEQGAAGAGPAHRVKPLVNQSTGPAVRVPERAGVPLVAQRRIRGHPARMRALAGAGPSRPGGSGSWSSAGHVRRFTN